MEHYYTIYLANGNYIIINIERNYRIMKTIHILMIVALIFGCVIS